MTDLLNEIDRARARDRGFEVCHVYDTATGRWSIQAIPTTANPLKSVTALQAYLYAQAQGRDELALRVLQLIAQGHKTEPPKRKGRK